MSKESASEWARKAASRDGWAEINRAAADTSSGAEGITKLAATGLALLAGAGESLETAIERLLEGHPGMAPLWRLAEECLSSGDPERVARSWRLRLERECLAAARFAARIVPSGLIVTISYSKTTIASLALAARIKEVEVICAQSDPGGEGERTAEELAGEGVSASLADDQRALDELATAAAFLCGADAVMPHAVRNKVGSRVFVEWAEHRLVPRIAIAGDSKFVASTLPNEPLLEDIPIEEFSRVVSDSKEFAANEAADHARSRDVVSVERLLAERA